MAGIQVPKVERFQPQPMDSVVDTRVNLPDVNKGANLQMQAVSNIAEDQINYFQKQEKAAVDTASKAAANKYNIYLNAELNNAKIQQGDPTHTYGQFTEKMNSKYEEILNENPNLSESAKASVKAALADVYTNYSMKSNTAYSGQYYDYDKQVTEDAVKMTAQDFMTASSYIDPKDEKSFQAVDALIGRIGNLYKSHGEKFGAVTRDENGNQVATNGINLQIAKATSDGLISAINNLNNGNGGTPRPDLAEALYSKYYKYIDTSKQDDISKRIQDKKTTIEIYDAANKTTNMSPDAIEGYLNKRFKDDPEAKAKAYEAVSTRSRQQEQLRNRSSDKSFKAASSIVFERQNNPYTAFNSAWEMEQDPKIAPFLDNLTAKQRKDLVNMVVQPKESNPETRIKFYEALQNDELKNMSPDKFFQSISGLNKSERAKATKIYEKFTSPQTPAEEARGMRSMMSDLKRNLDLSGYIKVDKFGKIPSEDHRHKLSEAYNELADVMDKLPATMSYTDRIKEVKKFTAEKTKAQIFKQDSGGFFGLSAPKSGDATLGNVQTKSAGKASRASAIRMYLQENETDKTPTTKELDEFIKRKGL